MNQHTSTSTRVAATPDRTTQHVRRARRVERRAARARARFGRFRTSDGGAPPDTWRGEADLGHAHARLSTPIT